MIVALLAILQGVVADAPAFERADGIGIGKRLVSAIKSEVEFQDSDFGKPLRDADKAALRQFGQCKLERIMYRTSAYPKLVSVTGGDPNSVRIVFNCKGVPLNTPASLTLHLREDGKIASVETHNADLMRVN